VTDQPTGRLTGKRIAFLVANAGVEEVELTKPWDALREAGAETVLMAPETGEVQAFEGDVNPAGTYEATLAVADADTEDFDGLVLPGGTTNPDKLRLHAPAVEFVSRFAALGRPVAAICHGPWTLVEADVVEGKTLTSWPSLRTDVRNAGGTWVDE
jgi:protease I